MPPGPYAKRKVIPCKNFLSGKCTKPGCQFLHEKKPIQQASTDVLIAMLRLLFEKNNSTILSGGGPGTGIGVHLNLSNFAECPDLQGVQSSVDFNTVAFCNALCQVIAEKCPHVEYLNLDRNNIKSLFHLIKAIEQKDLHIKLKGFSCAENQISTFDFAKQLAVCPNLVEVVFSGNPVASQDYYRKEIRKHLPTLLGIDGRGVEAMPLAIPWPTQSIITEQSLPILQFLEQHFFATLTGYGADGVIHLYAPSAIFSFSMDDDATFSTPKDYPKQCKNVPVDYIGLRAAQADNNRNISRSFKINKTKIGRTEVAAALKESLYPTRFITSHQLDGNANVVPLPPGVAGPTGDFLMVTVHGSMSWRHVDLPATLESSVSWRYFDRTLILRHSAAAAVQGAPGYEIHSDQIYLRKGSAGSVQPPEPLLFPTNESRVRLLANKYTLTVEVVRFVIEALRSVAMTSPEEELAKSLNAARRIGPQLVVECGQLAEGNPLAFVKLVRVVEQFRLHPTRAAQFLQHTNGDIAAIHPLLPTVSSDPTAFVQIV